MTIYRYPTLVWRDHSGWFTAAVVSDFTDAAAYAETEVNAIEQLKDLLRWRSEHHSFLAEPDLSEPQYLEVKVEVRPEYRDKKRPLPAPNSIWLRVPCVSGLDSHGLKICCIPHLSFSFNYQESESLKSLVAHYVKDELRNLHPLQLFQKLPPTGCELREIVLRAASTRSQPVPPGSRPELKLLFTIADPLLQTSRGRPSTSTYERDELINQLVEKIGVEKANVLLVGEAGAGKTAVLMEAVKRLARGENKEETRSEFRDYRFWRSSGGRLIAGMAFLGEWEERCEKVIERLSAIEGVLVAENLLELVQVGGQGAGDSVAAFLLPYLQRGELRCCAEATPTELEACKRVLPAILDLFQIVHVPVLDDSSTERVLTRIAAAAASGRRLDYAPGLSLTVQRLFARFRPHAALPGTATQFIRQLFEGKKTAVGLRDAIDLFIRQTGLPEVFLRDDLPMRAAEVRAALGRKIVGQNNAVEVACRVITTIKAGLTDPSRPFGVLLFTGPTGVGKTALAKAIADFCFGAGTEKDRLIRLDMSEYGGWGAAHRLLSGPENRAAPWIERVRAQPFSVVLFDEIEKADPEIFDVMLGLLDEGRLTDPFGRVTDFRSSIVILTSNIGSTSRGTAGFKRAGERSFQEEVARFFRPEFFNRLDAVVEFQPLQLRDVEEIARKELNDLATREGFTAAGIRLRWNDEVVAYLARTGYDERLGARPLQRVIERLIATPLARWRVTNPDLREMVLSLVLDPAGSIAIQTGR